MPHNQFYPIIPARGNYGIKLVMRHGRPLILASSFIQQLMTGIRAQPEAKSERPIPVRNICFSTIQRAILLR